MLDALPPGASESAQGGTAVALVCAQPAAVWAILTDWRNHPTNYPRVTRAEVTHADASRVRVRYTIAIGLLSFEVHMDKYPEAARRRVEWRIAEDHPSRFFEESSGYWQVSEAGAHSVVMYAVGTRTLLPAFLTRASHRDSRGRAEASDAVAVPVSSPVTGGRRVPATFAGHAPRDAGARPDRQGFRGGSRSRSCRR